MKKRTPTKLKLSRETLLGLDAGWVHGGTDVQDPGQGTGPIWTGVYVYTCPSYTSCG